MTTKEALTRLFGEGAVFPATCICGFRAEKIAGGLIHARKTHRIKFTNDKYKGLPIMQNKRTKRF